jgi:hypothetical protein
MGMVGPPRLHKLGANWVEVTVWERMKRRFNQRRNDLKTASNNPSISFRLGMMSKPEFPGRPCFPGFGEAAGAGQPFGEIFDFQLPIAN